jgi:hypothetical protein
MAMETGIRFSIIYSDQHLLELRIEASNGVFSGRADVYANLDAPREFAATLSDENRVTFGQWRLENRL